MCIDTKLRGKRLYLNRNTFQHNREDCDLWPGVLCLQILSIRNPSTVHLIYIYPPSMAETFFIHLLWLFLPVSFHTQLLTLWPVWIVHTSRLRPGLPECPCFSRLLLHQVIFCSSQTHILLCGSQVSLPVTLSHGIFHSTLPDWIQLSQQDHTKHLQRMLLWTPNDYHWPQKCLWNEN